MTDRAPNRSATTTDSLTESSAAENRSLAKWYAAARLALAHNRPQTTAATSTANRPTVADLSVAETAALYAVGAFDDPVSVSVDNDPLLKTQAQYMALLEESLTTAEAAKLLGVDVSRVRQRLRERTLLGIEHEGSWRLPRVQFERRFAIPGLPRVLKALPPDLFPLDTVDWLVLPDPELQLDTDPAPLTPREWLLSGRPIETVAMLARDISRA